MNRDWGAMSSSATRRPPAEGQPETGAGETAGDDRLRSLADQRNDELRTVLTNNMSEGVYSTDEQGRLTSLNPAAARLLGWAEADVLGEPAHDLLHGRRPDGMPHPADQPMSLDRNVQGWKQKTSPSPARS